MKVLTASLQAGQASRGRRITSTRNCAGTTTKLDFGHLRRAEWTEVTKRA
ncbi:hypothetical protein PQI07_31970 [Methylobacterium sp. 092160098-2]|nr:hypothetical protein [Methylobacterium sp. 092160098-2]MDE4915211.1 hypothetical protein [Methylobacterium sp. 092160098-2]